MYAFVMAPMTLFLVFPYQLLPNSVVWSTLILGCVGVLLYWLSFILFVKLKHEDRMVGHPENPAGR